MLLNVCKAVIYRKSFLVIFFFFFLGGGGGEGGRGEMVGWCDSAG